MHIPGIFHLPVARLGIKVFLLLCKAPTEVCLLPRVQFIIKMQMQIQRYGILHEATFTPFFLRCSQLQLKIT